MLIIHAQESMRRVFGKYILVRPQRDALVSGGRGIVLFAHSIVQFAAM